MEKRLKEAGLSMEQVGEHELIREVQRIQLWIQALNEVGPQALRQKDGKIQFKLWKLSLSGI